MRPMTEGFGGMMQEENKSAVEILPRLLLDFIVLIPHNNAIQ